MFFVHDNGIAGTIMIFYNDPENVRWRDEMDRLGTREMVEPYVESVRALRVDDFIKNGEWVGLNIEMDKYLPSITHNCRIDGNKAHINHMGALRYISITTDEPMHEIILKANDLQIYTTKVPSVNNCSLQMPQGFPTELLPYVDMTVCVDVKPFQVQATHTWFPLHISTELNNAITDDGFLVKYQGHKWRFQGGAMSIED